MKTIDLIQAKRHDVIEIVLMFFVTLLYWEVITPIPTKVFLISKTRNNGIKSIEGDPAVYAT